MVYRGAILFKYSFYYVDDDQALMWYGTVSFAHFDFHEPCFFGQSYGSMIESLLAVPFYFLHIPLKVALPVSTLIFTTLPFLYLGIKSLENNRMVAAYIILFVYGAKEHLRKNGFNNFSKFLNDEKYLYKMTISDIMDYENLDMVFNNNRADNRKEWLAQ